MLATVQNIGRARIVVGLVIVVILGLLAAQDSAGSGPAGLGAAGQWRAAAAPAPDAGGTWSASVATPDEVRTAAAERVARDGASADEIIGQFSAASDGTAAEGADTHAAGDAVTVAAAEEGGFEVVTKDLPTDYISGAPPSADLAATLRKSQARFNATQLPAPLQAASSIATSARVIYTRQSQVQDILSGGVDPRIIDMMTWITQRRQSITITSVKSDHSMCVAGSNPCRVSAHKMGRAIDIAAVDGEICTGIPTGKCGILYQEIVNTMRGTQYQPTQIIYGFDLWPSESWNFEMGNHHDHIHLAY